MKSEYRKNNERERTISKVIQDMAPQFIDDGIAHIRLWISSRRSDLDQGRGLTSEYLSNLTVHLSTLEGHIYPPIQIDNQIENIHQWINRRRSDLWENRRLTSNHLQDLEKLLHAMEIRVHPPPKTPAKRPRRQAKRAATP